jgi:hypothetical protein
MVANMITEKELDMPDEPRKDPPSEPDSKKGVTQEEILAAAGIKTDPQAKDTSLEGLQKSFIALQESIVQAKASGAASEELIKAVRELQEFRADMIQAQQRESIKNAIVEGAMLLQDESGNSLLYDNETETFLFDITGSPQNILDSAKRATQLYERAKVSSIDKYEKQFEGRTVGHAMQQPVSEEEWDGKIKAAKEKAAKSGDSSELMLLLEQKPFVQPKKK